MALSLPDTMGTIVDQCARLTSLLGELEGLELLSGARSVLGQCISISSSIFEVSNGYKTSLPTLVRANRSAEDGVATD